MGSIPQLSVVKGKQEYFNLKLMHQILEKNVELGCGLKPALIYRDNKTTYKQLNSSSNRLAKYIISYIQSRKLHSNQDGDWIIAVCMSPSDNLVKTLLAIWKAGAAYLPIDPIFPKNRIEHILKEAKPVLVIFDIYDNCDVFGETAHISYDKLYENSKNYNDGNISTENSLINGNTNLAIILYTSGSTGIPKGVRLPHSIIQNRLKWQWETFPYSATEKIGIFKTALTFVDSVSEIWGPLLNEMAILIITKDVTKDPERLIDVLQEYKIERLVLVPTLLRSILMYLSLKNQPNLLNTLKIWICSGESLTVSLAEEFFNYFQEGAHVLCNFYGSTEVMGDVTYFVCENKNQLNAYEKVPIGYPINNTVIYILDSEYRPVKRGKTGELFVSGLNLAHGYVNGRDKYRFIENPLAADPKFDRLYRTGDFASVLKDGIIQYEGRTDSQIKIRGHRVDITEIEKHLFLIDDVEKGIVICYHNGEIDQTLLAFVTISNNSRIKQGLLFENLLKSKLADYMIPQVIILESIPLLVNGKIDRQALLKIYENTNNNDDFETVDFDYANIPITQKNIARDLFEIVGQVIGRSARTTLTINSNFYELGGNSLNSIYTVTQLRNKGYFIGITEFISAKNLGDILKIISICPKDEIVDILTTNDNNKLTFISTMLSKEHKNEVIEIITTSFYEKADLEQWLKPDILYTDYGDILQTIWGELVEKELSFVVKDIHGNTVGVSLNFDARDEPEVAVNSKLIIVFEFLEYIEGPIRDNKLPKGLNAILHSFMMGTSSQLSAQENISIMNFMEEEVLKMAKRKCFKGILTTNTNPLTQQLGSSVYSYNTMLDYQVNRFVYRDGTKPFIKAPDTQRAIVHWKDIS